MTFTPGRGAPATAHIGRLASWSDSAEPGLRYFSGTGSYRKTFDVPAQWMKESRLLLDLGEVHELAHVWINGKDAGITIFVHNCPSLQRKARPTSTSFGSTAFTPW